MTTFAPNFTPRMRCRYRAAGVEHTVQVRALRGDSSGVTDALKNHLSDVFTAFSARLAEDFAWIAAEYALTDSEIWYPVALPDAVAGEVAVADFSPVDKVTALAFSGKSSQGRGRFYLYGLLTDVGDPASDTDDGVLLAAEDGAVASTVGIANSYFRSGGGTDCVWHPRATVKVNDHLLKLVRRGIIS